MAASQAVILRSAPWSPEAVAALSDAEACDTTGGMLGVEDYVDRGVLFEVVQGDEVVARYVLAVNSWARGNEGVIAYAQGKAGFDLVGKCLPLVEKQFIECATLQVQTTRRGLVRKMQKQGWRLAGYIMRKEP